MKVLLYIEPILLLLFFLSSQCVAMEGSRYTITMSEFKLFHGIDRSLYGLLLLDLCRDPIESLYIMGLWMWLERRGFSHFISKILCLPPFLISELADEAVTCLKCVNSQFPFTSEANEIPLTQSLVKKDISMQYFLDNHLTARTQIQNLVNGVCLPSFSDIMENVDCHSGRSQNQTAARKPQPDLSLKEDVGVGQVSATARDVVTKGDRTMFVTFSKGYPVSEIEVRGFFSRMFGNCIESFLMQEVRPDEQALYAKIVFLRPSFIGAILNGGARKAKFTINGKHVWMRKFVAKNE